MTTKKEESIISKAGGFINDLIGDGVPDYLKGKPEETPKNQQIQEKTIKQISNMSETITITPTDTKETDSRYEEQILAALRSANLPGPDYFEFSEAVRKLKEINPTMSIDDVIKNAFIVLSASGLTKQRILETGDHYRGVLSEEEGKFEHAILQGSQDRVNTPKQKIVELKKHNDDLKAQLQQIQNQIDLNESEIERTEAAITTAENKLSLNKAKFHNTVSKVKNDMEDLLSHVQKINL